MRRPVGLLASLSILLSIGLSMPGAARAATVEQLVALAEAPPHSMTCTGQATSVTCSRIATNFKWDALIGPRTGPSENLDTTSNVPSPPLDSESTKWMKAMHGLACGKQAQIDAFVDQIAAMTKDGALGPVEIGVCSILGSVDVADLSPASTYVIRSQVLPPPPTPRPTRTPRPPRPTPTATPTPTASPSPPPTPSPSVEPSPSPSSAPTAAPTPTPDLGGHPTNGPAPIGAPGGGTTPAPSLPTFSQSVLAISDVNADGGAVGGSLLLALLLLLLIAFAGELFNNTVENNYLEISGWFKKGPLGWVRRLGGGLGRESRIGVLAFIALTALISSFVDPSFGFDVRSLAVFLGFLVGLIVVLASFKLPTMLAHRRKTGELGRLRPLPWALVIAVLFVLLSRIASLQPGYLYGIVLGAIFLKEVSDKEEGRETFYGSLWTLGAAVLAWIGLGWARSLGFAEDGFGITLLETAFAATLVAGLEAAAFGLMPMRFLPGHAVYRWNRLAWALLFGLSVFAFVHILIGPTSGYVYELAPEPFLAALGVFAAFGALSIGTWLYFRLRRPLVAVEA